MADELSPPTMEVWRRLDAASEKPGIEEQLDEDLLVRIWAGIAAEERYRARLRDDGIEANLKEHRELRYTTVEELDTALRSKGFRSDGYTENSPDKLAVFGWEPLPTVRSQ